MPDPLQHFAARKRMPELLNRLDRLRPAVINAGPPALNLLIGHPQTAREDAGRERRDPARLHRALTVPVGGLCE